MAHKKRFIAAAELLLIFPAAIFLMAVVARRLEPLQFSAQQIITWYTARNWTLWVLLVSLPFIALFIGFVTLLWNATGGIQQILTASRSSTAMRIIFAAAIAAGFILMVVGLHVLAN